MITPRNILGITIGGGLHAALLGTVVRDRLPYGYRQERVR